MKKLFYILTFLFPVVVCAQQNWYKSSPLDYMWINVGNSGFSTGEVDYTSLAFSPSGEPYIACQDWANFKKATVMKFNGTDWVVVESAGFSAEEADYTSIAFNLSGEPYVAYTDSINSYKTTVMKFNGISWLNVGLAGFSAGMAEYSRIAISQSGQPYVAYQDYGNSGKATVMKYDSTFIGINDPKESRLSLYPNPAIDKITVETSGIPTQSKLSMMNLSGQQVLTRQITAYKTQIDISSLPSGVYFVRLTGDRTVQVGKFVKQ